ncbi:hypothetical protein F5B19DRAFT_396054 [Rostrohypoxylon terebratum]|nr:hypothetical protein F5B19DRAFT_396054 [Rostrohypoxylon terebratum]
MSSQLDLALPATVPELEKFAAITCQNEPSLAVYSLVELPMAQLEEMVSFLVSHVSGIGHPLHIRLAEPTPDFSGKTLKDIFQAHLTMVEKGFNPVPCEAPCELPCGIFAWSPCYFIVVVKKDWKSSADGLLLVFHEKGHIIPIDKVFFSVEDSVTLLDMAIGEEASVYVKADSVECPPPKPNRVSEPTGGGEPVQRRGRGRDHRK